MSAAYDTLRHSTIIRKLKLYNLSNSSLKWFENYLGKRASLVEVGAHMSEVRRYDQEVAIPQGSILAPILFNMFTNENSEVLRKSNCSDPTHNYSGEQLFKRGCNTYGICMQYADDSIICIAASSVIEAQDKLTKSLGKMKQHYRNNGLQFNCTKTKIMLAGTSKKLASITKDNAEIKIIEEGKILKQQKSCTLLGVTLSENMTFGDHILKGKLSIKAKMNIAFGALRRFINNLDFKSKKTLANGLIISRIHTTAAIWAGTPTNTMAKIKKSQNRRARFICRKTIMDKIPVKTLLNNCGWPSVRQIAYIHALVTYKKINPKHQHGIIYINAH